MTMLVKVAILILLELTLQYMEKSTKKVIAYGVAILILLELTLQFIYKELELEDVEKCRNPYFIGINSAIYPALMHTRHLIKSQSLFYWN